MKNRESDGSDSLPRRYFVSPHVGATATLGSICEIDSLFYRLLQELPSCYFEAIGGNAKDAEGYSFTAEEIKLAGRRLDGVFTPIRPGLPVHFVEVYLYAADNAYANLFAKVFL